MVASAFELFRVGPGPSSMQVVGPHLAAQRFVHEIAGDGLMPNVHRVEVELFGGLAFSGRDLGTDRAVMAGLTGLPPERCDTATMERCAVRIETERLLPLANGPSVAFAPHRDLRFVVDRAVAYDGNAMRFVVRDRYGAVLASRVYFSTGHGHVVGENDRPAAATIRLPYRFVSADAMLAACAAQGKRVADLGRTNECIRRSPDEVRTALLHVASVMRAAVQRGLITEGVLRSGTRRTAPTWSAAMRDSVASDMDPHVLAQRAALYATAVAEENAAGGRVVAAPSSGSAGPVAALLQLWHDSTPLKYEDGVVEFLLVGTAIGGMLRAAGVAHVGCQSEIGVAAAMAAAGYASVLGGSDAQIVHAAELALRPHLGLTCDPAAGRIEDPCIERNALAASRACAAALTAVRAPSPRNGMDATIRAMVASGQMMATRSKSTSLAGVAVNLAEC